MKISLKREVFNSSTDEQLIWACIEPAIQPIRGRNFQVKSQIYSQLTAGQRALLMFQVLYGHTRNGITEFIDHTSYFLEETGVWSEFKAGMRYFKDDEMLRFLEELEGIWQDIRKNKPQENTGDLDNLEKEPGIISTSHSAIGQLDRKFHEILPKTLHRIGAYIRNHPDEFVQIEADSFLKDGNLPDPS